MSCQQLMLGKACSCREANPGGHRQQASTFLLANTQPGQQSLIRDKAGGKAVSIKPECRARFQDIPSVCLCLTRKSLIGQRSVQPKMPQIAVQ